MVSKFENRFKDKQIDFKDIYNLVLPLLQRYKVKLKQKELKNFIKTLFSVLAFLLLDKDYTYIKIDEFNIRFPSTEDKKEKLFDIFIEDSRIDDVNEIDKKHAMYEILHDIVYVGLDNIEIREMFKNYFNSLIKISEESNIDLLEEID